MAQLLIFIMQLKRCNTPFFLFYLIDYRVFSCDKRKNKMGLEEDDVFEKREEQIYLVIYSISCLLFLYYISINAFFVIFRYCFCDFV